MKYDLIPQKKDNYCICSCLQAILKSYHFDVSQNEIARSLTSSKHGFRGDDENIEKFLETFGLEYKLYWNYQTPFNEPDTLLGEMDRHNGIIGINTHVYLLDNFKDPNCYLIDPKNGEVDVKDICWLVNEMKNTGFFAVIKKQ